MLKKPVTNAKTRTLNWLAWFLSSIWKTIYKLLLHIASLHLAGSGKATSAKAFGSSSKPMTASKQPRRLYSYQLMTENSRPIILLWHYGLKMPKMTSFFHTPSKLHRVHLSSLPATKRKAVVTTSTPKTKRLSSQSLRMALCISFTNFSKGHWTEGPPRSSTCSNRAPTPEKVQAYIDSMHSVHLKQAKKQAKFVAHTFLISTSMTRRFPHRRKRYSSVHLLKASLIRLTKESVSLDGDQG